jgi:hypothetical protein
MALWPAGQWLEEPSKRIESKKKPPRGAAFQTPKGRYTLTGCLLRTGTGVSQLNRSAFSPRMIA